MAGQGAAAIAIEGVESEPDADGAEGIRLLADCRTVFDVRRELKHTKEEADEISAANLIIELCALEENPWKDYGFGKPITERRFAVILRDFGIKSKKRTKDPDRGKMRWYRADFEDAWKRYLPENSESDGSTPF
jgi:hypothetical protein